MSDRLYMEVHAVDDATHGSIWAAFVWRSKEESQTAAEVLGFYPGRSYDGAKAHGLKHHPNADVGPICDRCSAKMKAQVN